MQSTNEVTILGDPAALLPRVYKLAANIQEWPSMLPHYRYVRVLEQSRRHKVAKFGARRGYLPVYWKARPHLFPETNRDTFEHIGGITRGMQVEWRMEPCEGGLHVTIFHELSYPIPVLGPWFAKSIVGKYFVQNIADKTLRCFKELLEGLH